MDPNEIKIYFIIVNMIAFILSGIKVTLLNYHKKVDILQYIIDWVIFLGGGIGSGIIFLIFERTVNKKDFSRFLMKTALLCAQVIYLLCYFGPFKEQLQGFLQTQLDTHSYFIYYLLAINIITAFIFMFDKMSAMLKSSRIREVTLFFFSSIGGSLGAILMMFLFRHKIRNVWFYYGIPCIFVVQVILICFFYQSLTNF